MKTAAFAMGLSIGAVGAAGLAWPGVLLWIAGLFTTPGPFYVVAAVRIALGSSLLLVARSSRLPWTLRVLGTLILLAGLIAGVSGFAAFDRSHAMIEDWARQGPGVLRLTALPLVALGVAIAYACAPRPQGRGT